jgi:hypothetical protein
VSAACVLVVGVPIVLWIEALPSERFAVFNALGPTLRPWLVGAAAIIAVLPALGLIVLVQRLLKLPRV